MTPHYRMRRLMDAPAPPAALPAGIVVRQMSEWTARDCRELMNEVYGLSEGEAPVAFEPWWAGLTGDSEYEATLCQVALSGDRVVGYCHGWRVPFVKDLVVAPGWRRHGLGGALLARLLDSYRERGAVSVDLKTAVTNATAQSLYRRFGFEVVERIG